MRKFWIEESGGLTVEWILVIVLLVVGIIGGTAAIRDSLIIETGEMANAVLKFDGSYSVSAPMSLSLTHMQGGSDLQSATLSGFSNNANVAENYVEPVTD